MASGEFPPRPEIASKGVPENRPESATRKTTFLDQNEESVVNGREFQLLVGQFLQTAEGRSSSFECQRNVLNGGHNVSSLATI